MLRENGSIKLTGGTIAYTRGGYGGKLLLAFPGYGHTGTSLAVFEKYLAQEYTIYYVDLPHHGLTQWPEGTMFLPTDLHQLVSAILILEQQTTLSLLGYSMGGRVCLKILELFPEQIGKMLLMATDGLSPDPIYYLATRSLAGRKLFHHIVTRPDGYLRFINWLQNKKLVDSSLHKMSIYYLGSVESRRQLSLVWPTMAAIVPIVSKIRETLLHQKTLLHIVMGRYDKLMPASRAKKFASGLPFVQVHVLEKGHRVFDTSNVATIAQYLL